MQPLRDACATVAARSRRVRIDADAIPAYAAGLPTAATGLPTQATAIPGSAAALPPAATAPGPDPDGELAGASREQRAAFWLTLDAINFGSGWFPTLRKRPGGSGYRTIAAGIHERFAARGAWSAEELSGIPTSELAAALGQDPGHELMALFAASLRDLGKRVWEGHRGRFAAVVDAADGSAVALARRLGGWSCFADTSRYDEIVLPFLKRAQIAAADLARAGVADFGDLAGLTMFADNLVPHVLRLDGILWFDPDLVARIDREELIEHGSPEEVEIRACALHAVELIVAEAAPITAAEVDAVLWHRGGGPFYKASPRHRSRCTAY